MLQCTSTLRRMHVPSSAPVAHAYLATQLISLNQGTGVLSFYIPPRHFLQKYPSSLGQSIPTPSWYAKTSTVEETPGAAAGWQQTLDRGLLP
eukprot:7208668-Alexandrium_andersonii.AAC.1